MSGPWQNTAPVTVDDIQRRLGLKPQDPPHPLFPTDAEWAAIRARTNSASGRAAAGLSDIGARTQAAVDAARSAIDSVVAQPRRPTNAFHLVGSMADLAPTLLGAPLAAGVDKLTGPPVRAVNNAFGTNWSPQTPTDNLMNAAGFVIGPGEIKAGLKAAGEAALALPAIPPIEAGLVGRLTGKTLPELKAAIPAVAADTPAGAGATLASIQRVDPRLMDKPHFMPDDRFADTVQLAGDNLAVGLPTWAKAHYDNVIDDAIRGPILDDPDFAGFSHRQVGDALSTLKSKAFQYRQDPAKTTACKVADAFDQVYDELVSMVGRNQAGLGPVKPAGPTRPPIGGGPAFLGDTSGGAMIRQLPVKQGPIASFSPDIEDMLPPIGDPARADKIAVLKMVMGASNDLTTWKQFLANPDQFVVPAGLGDPASPGVKAVSPTYSPQTWTPSASND